VPHEAGVGPVCERVLHADRSMSAHFQRVADSFAA
jgi:hypothetical protein